MSPDYCPNCGAEVPPRSKACPECGSDEKTGWSEDATAQRLDLPDDQFNYEEFVREEFGATSQNPIRPRGISWLWWAVAILVIVSILVMLVQLFR